MNNKEIVLTPSSLSYLCSHCLYMKQNYGLFNKSISAGITQTLDGIEKNYFLGDRFNPLRFKKDLVFFYMQSNGS